MTIIIKMEKLFSSLSLSNILFVNDLCEFWSVSGVLLGICNEFFKVWVLSHLGSSFWRQKVTIEDLSKIHFDSATRESKLSTKTFCKIRSMKTRRRC